MGIERRLLWGVLCTVASVAIPGQTQAQSTKPIVAVFDIEDKGVGLKRALCSRLSDYMSMTLAATGKYQVVPRDQLKKRLVQQKRGSYKQCYDQTCQIEIGKELAAQKSLTTMVMKLGSKCMVTTVLYDLKKSASEGGASAEGGCTEDGIVASIKTVVQRLVGDKRVKAPAAAKAPPRRKKKPRNKDKAARPAGYGGLFIKSAPPGAEVWLDGVKASGVTPLTVSDLMAGEHLLEIKKDTYRYAGKAGVAPDKFTTVSVALKKVKIRLQILSAPPEATITLGGKVKGKTPMILLSIPAGDHVLLLSKEGFIASKRLLRISAASPRQTVNVTLEAAGYIVARSDPPGAALEVDGRTVGETPRRVPVDPGKHEVRFSMTGREAARTEVEVKAGQEAVVSVTLELTESEKSKRAQAAARRKQQAQRRAQAEAHYRLALQAHERSSAPVRSKRRSKSVWGWAALGVGSALAVSAAVMYGVGASAGGDAHDSYMNTTDSNEIYDYRQDIDAARTQLAVGHVLAGAAVAAIGFSVYQFLTRPAVPEAPGRQTFFSSVSASAAPGGGVVALGGSF